MSDIAKIDELLTKAEVFFLATIDGDKPKNRPLGFHMLDGDKIYFGVGTFKEVYRQIEANPNVEISAWDGEHILRYYGEVKIEKNDELVDKAFELMPELGEMYKANGWEMGIFYIDKATAEIRNMFEIEESYTFEY
ncbi:MAG: pyridoxamine 5'-phosphate oxidase family protein [Methanobrevibacter sp.]|uniref:pyridoxamine 5'-phosphate oxidase family protein n=1 Tax=Methanobrevibacter sp. TaxID=66852 RepID=UPI0025ECB9D7|nr:pyridoxamine 5'-phosphate oxidase family protein [Methanobrevibacter sp.]MBQ6098586.1 pyridoxamine 5'-phosphate oxidase family protein [Methanobrevibacter sp.]